MCLVKSEGSFLKVLMHVPGKSWRGHATGGGGSCWGLTSQGHRGVDGHM
jgi:hypothetical protein